MDELIYASAKSIAQAIRDKQVSAVEVVEAHLERIEEVNPKLNAVVQLASERALDEAREADAALARGESKGPLHGVPMTIKDSLETAGIVSTAGTIGRKSQPALPNRCGRPRFRSPRPETDGAGARAASAAREAPSSRRRG